MTLGTMDIHGVGAIRGITADGTPHGTGILGTIAAGTVDGMADGTIRGTTVDGAMAIIITTTTSSALAADGSILHASARPAQAEEAESVPHQGARE